VISTVKNFHGKQENYPFLHADLCKNKIDKNHLGLKWSLNKVRFNPSDYHILSTFCRINKEFHNVIIYIYFSDFYYNVLRDILYNRYNAYGKVFDLFYINWHSNNYLRIVLKRGINKFISTGLDANSVFNDFINYGISNFLSIFGYDVNRFYSAHDVQSFECAFGNIEMEHCIPKNIPFLNQHGDNKLDLTSWGWSFNAYRDNSPSLNGDKNKNGELEFQYYKNQSSYSLDSVLLQIDRVTDDLFNTNYQGINEAFCKPIIIEGYYEGFAIELNGSPQKHFGYYLNDGFSNKKMRYENYG